MLLPLLLMPDAYQPGRHTNISKEISSASSNVGAKLLGISARFFFSFSLLFGAPSIIDRTTSSELTVESFGRSWKAENTVKIYSAASNVKLTYRLLTIQIGCHSAGHVTSLSAWNHHAVDGETHFQPIIFSLDLLLLHQTHSQCCPIRDGCWLATRKRQQNKLNFWCVGFSLFLFRFPLVHSGRTIIHESLLLLSAVKDI